MPNKPDGSRVGVFARIWESERDALQDLAESVGVPMVTIIQYAIAELVERGVDEAVLIKFQHENTRNKRKKLNKKIKS